MAIQTNGSVIKALFDSLTKWGKKKEIKQKDKIINEEKITNHEENETKKIPNHLTLLIVGAPLTLGLLLPK